VNAFQFCSQKLSIFAHFFHFLLKVYYLLFWRALKAQAWQLEPEENIPLKLEQLPKFQEMILIKYMEMEA